MSREAFENWWDGLDITDNGTKTKSTVLELMWESWQASRAQAIKECADELKTKYIAATRKGNQTAMKHIDDCIETVRKLKDD